MQGKMGGVSGFQVTIVIIAIALVGLVGFFVYQDGGAQSVTGAVTESGEVIAVTGVVSCPSDGTTDGQVRFQDTLASTITYDASPTVYFMPLTPGMERVTAGALSANDYSTAVDLKCVESGTQWQAVAVTTSDDMSSAVGDVFTAEGSYVKTDVQGVAIDSIQFKVADLETGPADFFNITTCTTSAGRGWQWFNGTQCTVANDAGRTTLTLGADGYIDSTIYVKTNSTKAQFGEDGLHTWLLVDADSSSWGEPLVTRDGVAIPAQTSSALATEDQRKYSGYEYAFDIGVIGERQSLIDFYLESASGVNPGASDDPVIEFCAEGRYASVKQQDAINIGCWTDAATQVAVATSELPKFKFDVS